MPEQKSIWQTAPGTVAAIAAMVTALAGAIPVIIAVRGHGDRTSPAATASPSASPSASAGPDPSSGAMTREWDPASPDAAAVPVVIASPASLDFGKVTPGLSSSPKPVQFVNTGAEPVTLGKLRIIGPGAAAFTVASTTCTEGTALAPESGCDAQFRFASPSAGPQQATLVLDRAPGEPLTVPLTGTASLL